MQTIKLQGKDYAPVNERVKAFRTEHPDYSLTSEIISNENGVCVMRASILDEQGKVRATGHASEKEGSSNVNRTSYIENCETSAWGRALANLGYGIDGSIASVDELMNALGQQGEIDNHEKEQMRELEEILYERAKAYGISETDLPTKYFNEYHVTITKSTPEQLQKAIDDFGKRLKAKEGKA